MSGFNTGIGSAKSSPNGCSTKRMSSTFGGVSHGSGSHSANTGSRKITIKNFSLCKALAVSYLTEWEKLKEAMEAIYYSKTIDTSLEDLYRAVENVCTHCSADDLYNDLRTVCDLYVQSNLPKFLVDNVDTEQYLKNLGNLWESYCCQILMIRSIFLFLDRQHVLFNPSLLSLWDLGLSMFSRHILCNETIQRKCVGGILELIDQERKGNTVDRQLLKTLLRMLADLNLYKSTFEPKFLEATRNLFSTESQRLVETVEVADYLKHVETRLAEENDRLNHYLGNNTRQELIFVVLDQLISTHLDKFVDKGLDSMLAEEVKHDDLSRIYNLLARVETGLSKLCTALKSYIIKIGFAIVQNTTNDPEKDKDMVQRLLDFKDKIDDIQSKCFHSNDKFHYIMIQAFESLCNCRPNKPAEYIAKYIDQLLRAGNKGATEEELEKILDKIMVLFRFIQGKDVFEAFYKKDLAKRLLIGKSASSDAEKSMLSKLKQECGSGYTNKLEGMFKDVELSHDINIAFKQHLSQLPNISIDMSVNVLTMGFWPTYQPCEILLPEEMLHLQDIFRNFYLSKHNGRRLYFQHSLGYCGLKAQFSATGSRKEMQVSVFQTLVLLLFNNKDKLSYSEIKAGTAIEDTELKRTVLSLSVGKQRVLHKDPMNKEVDEKDTFLFNSDFKHKLIKIKFNQIQLKETDKEQKMTEERVFADRQFQVDAAIVRIMKTRKSLQHNLLMQELLELLKFPCKASDLKKRIESLIDRDYMRRDTEQQNIYHYVA